MRIELGAPVVVALINGDAQAELYHLPNPVKTVAGAYGKERLLDLAQRFSARGFFPSTWPSLCGLEGPVYAYDGALRARRCCGVCRARAPREVRAIAGAVCPRRHRGGKPRWKHSRIKPAHLEVLHRIYVEEQVSVRELARRVYQRLGYASAESCAESLYTAFAVAGYELRSVSDALRLRNTKHGRRAREAGESGPAVAAYRRWLKEERGQYRPRCKGVKATSPGRGSPCRRPAMAGSDYCVSHEPDRRERQLEHLAAMRARQKQPEFVAWTDVRVLLEPWLAQHRYPASRLSEASGVPHGTCSRLLNDRAEMLTAELAERLLRGVGRSRAGLEREEPLAA